MKLSDKVRRMSRITAIQNQARTDFAAHQIRDQRPGHWICYRRRPDGPWTGDCWFEAIVTWGGTLVVTGDIDLVHFAQYGKYLDPEEVLRWMGGTEDLAGYVSQKASIGMNLSDGDGSSRGVLSMLDEYVWLDDMANYAQSCLEEHGLPLEDPESRDFLPEWLGDLMACVLIDEEDVHQAVADLQHGESSHEAYQAGAFDWGVIPSSRLIYAHEALRKLVSLIDAQRSAEEK
jgi:hypothetical protein